MTTTNNSKQPFVVEDQKKAVGVSKTDELGCSANSAGAASIQDALAYYSSSHHNNNDRSQRSSRISSRHRHRGERGRQGGDDDVENEDDCSTTSSSFPVDDDDDEVDHDGDVSESFANGDDDNSNSSYSSTESTSDQDGAGANSSGTGGKSSGKNKKMKSTTGNQDMEMLALHENTAVRRGRYLTFCGLFVIAVLASAGVYWYTYSDQVATYEISFRSNGHRILKSFPDRAQRQLQALHSLAKTLKTNALLTSHGGGGLNNTNSNSNINSTTAWPFLTFEESAQVLEPYLALADAASIQVLTIVPKTLRSEWESYSVNHQEWIDHDLSTRDLEMDGGVVADRRLSDRDRERTTRNLQDQVLATTDSGTENSVNHMMDNNASRLGSSSSTFPSSTAETTEAAITPSGSYQTPSQYYYGDPMRDRNHSIHPYIHNYVGIDTSTGPWIVWWQYAPVVQDRYFVNFNMRHSHAHFDDEVAPAIERQQPALSQAFTVEPGLDQQTGQDYDFWNNLFKARGAGSYGTGEPLSFMYYPITEKYKKDEHGHRIGDIYTVALISATVYWKSYLEDILSEDVKGMIVVVENSVGQVFTYELNGKEANFLGMKDLHDPAYGEMLMMTTYSQMNSSQTQNDDVNGFYYGQPLDTSHMSYSIKVYASADMAALYLTSEPIVYTAAMVAIFFLTAGIFILYDILVEKRQKKVYSTAVKSTAVVESLFPQNVRDRLYEQQSSNLSKNKARRKDPSKRRKGGMDASERSTRARQNLPIADFFPDTTIFFGDIRGFTAWCSTREPAQVFSLLETVYNAFDDIAQQRHVFKVETVGDCYVAVSGLPNPKKDHAIAIARFAREALHRFSHLVKDLEVALGPDTAELGIRCGLHSGAVTGGVIRGQNARFQLFGDTVNTAARMESTGEVNRIQISQDTADLLKAAGKEHWYIPREEQVYAKGKGYMRTYWLQSHQGSDTPDHPSSTGSNTGKRLPGQPSYQENLAGMTLEQQRKVECMSDSRTMRLVNWNVDLLSCLLQKIVAHREASGIRQLEKEEIYLLEENHFTSSNQINPIEEVKEVITLPSHDISVDDETIKSIHLDKMVLGQLLDFVSNIAAMYNENPFHSFEHASHVTMSVQKLLARIIAPSSVVFSKDKTLHDHTYGITSDPLTQFSCVLSALIHDVDHNGVPNAQLVKEKSKVAHYYKDKSVAEQNSVDLAWNLLMDDTYRELRATIYRTETEMLRFRQLVVNTVMATDIVDKDLKALRNKRWDCAFHNSPSEEDLLHRSNRKATIVIEHLIQASDIAHTMQHWHVYRKWNERFFMECYKAFKQGRADADPSESWYKGEMAFFDFYIIPLAKKLKECGVFGVSSDEYLNYALKNRQEWEIRGMEAVSEMKEKALKEKHWEA